jgi:hypothetical protein
MVPGITRKSKKGGIRMKKIAVPDHRFDDGSDAVSLPALPRRLPASSWRHRT